MTSKIRYHGWHWYYGPGNDRDTNRQRPLATKAWAVLCWTVDGTGYASSACWVAPMTQESMTAQGKWGAEIIPDKY